MATVARPVNPVAIPSYSLRSLSLIGVCFVLSGATGLIYELLWARKSSLGAGSGELVYSGVFRAGSQGLTDNVVFVQWLQIYQLSTENLQSILSP